MTDILQSTAKRAQNYLETLDNQAVFPSSENLAMLSQFDESLPEDGNDPEAVLAFLDGVGSPTTVACAGSRYFGFVTGGAVPVTLAANWLAGAWDQNAAMVASSPLAAKIEEVTARWLVDMLHLPPETGVGFVTGATMANFTALAAARHAILEKSGWNVEAQGLFGAPPITVVVGDEVHVSLLKALSLLGLGRERVIRVPVDGQGRMRVDQLPELTDSTIVCIQAGNVNTGAFDPAEEICAIAHQAGSWVHVDGAFGLWAAASSKLKHLATGLSECDSWATDAHKWLNVPYDSGLAFVRNPLHLRAAMTAASAAYLLKSEQREPYHFTPEMSRRARGIEIWALLRTLGRSGLIDLFERNCRQARRFAEGLHEAGYTILNEVVLNQVMVSFGDTEITEQIITAIQEDGTCWCGGTVWQGHTAMRISLSSWATTDEDVEQSLDAMLRLASGKTTSA